MDNKNTGLTDSSEVNPAAKAWEKMAKEVESTRKEQPNNPPETNKETYVDLKEIDITTDQGKLEWLEALVENARTRCEEEQHDIIIKEGLYGMSKEEQEDYLALNDTYQRNKQSLDLLKREDKVLQNLDIDNEGGVLGALKRRAESFSKASDNPNATNEKRETAYLNYDATTQLHQLLSMEIADRNL